MNRDLKWMLLGIFLGVAAIWCLMLGQGNMPFAILGGYMLPIVAVICFGTGFTGVDDKPPPAESSPKNPQNEESDQIV